MISRKTKKTKPKKGKKGTKNVHGNKQKLYVSHNINKMLYVKG